MAESARFQKLRLKRGLGLPPEGPLDREAFLGLLAQHVTREFERTTGLATVTIPLELPVGRGELRVLAHPTHPACADAACPETCAASWDNHLTQLSKAPGPHWHVCGNDRLCGVVPVVWQGRCLAAIQLVCRRPMGEEAFLRYVDHLAALSEFFVSAYRSPLRRWLGSRPRPGRAPAGEAGRRRTAGVFSYVRREFLDPDLTVAKVAARFGLNRSYLAHLFAQQQKMGLAHYITLLRLGHAEDLLATTRLPISKIAEACRIPNPGCLRQAFRAYRGVSPSEFRRLAAEGR